MKCFNVFFSLNWFNSFNLAELKKNFLTFQSVKSRKIKKTFGKYFILVGTRFSGPEIYKTSVFAAVKGKFAKIENLPL